MEQMIYLDNAATTFPKPECVYEKMDQINRSLAVNAGRGSYALARKAAELIREVRRELLESVNGTTVAEVVLTPSATVAFNQIIGGMEFTEQDVVYVSPFEHNAVIRTLYLRKKEMEHPFQIMELPCRKENGIEIDMEQTEYQFSRKMPTYVFLSHVSNVIGYVLPVEEIAAAAKQYQATVVADASQSLGLVPIDFRSCSIDFLVFAGHKTMYGPLGIGGFFMKNGQKLKPYLAGGTGTDSLNPDMPEQMPERYEPASPNIVAAGGLAAALEEWKRAGDGSYKEGILKYLAREVELTQRLVKGLQKIPDVKLYLPPKEKHVGIAAFCLSGYQAADVGMILDEDYHIAVRTGYHCAPLIHKILQDETSAGVVRVSVGRFTTEEEIDTLIEAVGEIAEG